MPAKPPRTPRLALAIVNISDRRANWTGGLKSLSNDRLSGKLNEEDDMDGKNESIEYSQHESFGLLLTDAIHKAHQEYRGSVTLALLGVTVSGQIPANQREAWGRFCHDKGYSLLDAALEEMQRLRRLCFNDGINPDTGQRFQASEGP